MFTHNTSDIIRLVAERADLTKGQAEVAVKALIAVITDAAVQRDKVRVRHLVTFEARDYGPRRAHSVRSNKVIDIPARVRLVFKPAKCLRDI